MSLIMPASRKSGALAPWSLTWRFLSGQRWRILGALVAAVLTILSSIGLLSISAYLIERASQRPPILSLIVAIVAVRFFGIARGVFRYVDRYLAHDASFRVLGALRADVYRALIPLAPAGLDDLGRGDLLVRVAADVDSMQEWFVRGFVPLSTSAITLLIVAIAAAAILPTAGVALLVMLLGAGVAMVMIARARGGRAREEIELRGQITASTVEYIQGLADLSALGAAHAAAARIDATERRRAGLAGRRARRTALAIGLQTALPGLIATVLGAIAINRLGGGFDPLQVGVLVFAGMAAVECVFAVPAAVEAWERGLAAARRLAEIESRPVPVDTTGTRALPCMPRQLDLSDLTFGYEGTARLVLDGASMSVAAGQRTVIVGESGAGKSTLASLLLRFRFPTSGSISLDGINIALLEELSFRRAVGAVTQHAHLFAGTIRDNILLARPGAQDEDLRQALEGAQLGEWISSLPQGWDTEVGERGVTVSGGQCRRIALARALLAGFSFLIADEPTEGLDDSTGRAVMETLFSAGLDLGLIVITHRPDLCPPADATFELVNGRLSRLR